MGILDRWRGRAAPTPLYQPARMFVVPRLDLARERTPTSVSAQAATNPFIFGPMYQVALRMGSLPIKVYELAPAEGDRMQRRERQDHDSYTLLRHPNPDITRSYLIAGTVLSMFSTSHAAWVKVRERADEPPYELWPVPGESFVPNSSPTRLFTGITIKLAGKPNVFIPSSEICYFRLVPHVRDYALPFTPFETLIDAGDMGEAALDVANELYEQGMIERRYISASEPMDDDAFNRLKVQIEQARSERGSMPFLEEGIEIKPMGDGPDDEQMLRAMDQTTKLVQDTLGIPADANEKAFFMNAIGPVADAIEQELERSFFNEWPERLFGEFAFRDVLKGSPEDRANFHLTRIQSGQETINEARSDWDLPPIEGGDRTFIPLNLMPVDEEQDGHPREKDSAGGLGGDEGRDTLPRVATPTARASGSVTRRRNRWGRYREATTQAHTEAVYRRVRGILRKLGRRYNELLVPARAAQSGLPSIEDLLDILHSRDAELAAALRAALREMSKQVWDEAQALINATPGEIAVVVEQAIDQKVDVMLSRFAMISEERLRALFERAVTGEITVAQMAEELAATWSSEISSTVAYGIASDGVGYAFEQAALYAWATEGIRMFDVVYGGGPCTTGVCQEVAAGGPYESGTPLDSVGFSFLGTTTPPLHPNCGCYAVAATDAMMTPTAQGV